MAAAVDEGLTRNGWFVTGRMDASLFSDDFFFEDPNVRYQDGASLIALYILRWLFQNVDGDTVSFLGLMSEVLRGQSWDPYPAVFMARSLLGRRYFRVRGLCYDGWRRAEFSSVLSEQFRCVSWSNVWRIFNASPR